jgi:hypothetical protein
MSEQINLTLSRGEALVLFDWIASLDSKAEKPVVDEAEQDVLWEIEAQLEKKLYEILSPDYDKLLASAKERLLATDE